MSIWKWFLKQALRGLAEPVLDAIIAGLEELAKRTENEIDDAFVAKFKEFKEALLGFILGNIDGIVKKA